MSDGGTSNHALAQRLVVLRQSLGMNQSRFAALVGITQSAMNNYEGGIRRPKLDVAQTIVARTGATLDWLYLGNRAGLPSHLAQRLPEVPFRRYG